MKKVTDNKQVLIIVASILAIVLIGIIAFYMVNNKDQTPNTPNVPVEENKKEENVEDKVISPAKTTEELKTKVKPIEVAAVDADSVTFKDENQVKEGEKIAVWVYSTPKFLGYFDVVVENGTKIIKGLAEKIEKLDIETGLHNIALVNSSGVSIGYFDITINIEGKIAQQTSTETKNPEEEQKEDNNKETEENKVEQNSTKEETVEEKIAYTTKKVNEVNQKKGTKTTSQKGVNGVKKVTYSVTYNSEGKEISRKKISETITKKPVEEIIKVGLSDFNLNTAKMTGATHGFMCSENELGTEEDGSKYCNDREGQILQEFYAIAIDKVYYATCANTTGCFGEKVNAFVPLTKVSGMLFKGTLKGKTYYFEGRAGGGDDTPLTKNDCDTFKITCGTW